jgi:hypothetical protein
MLVSNTVYKPLGPQTQPRMQAHDIFCIHTMVGSLAGTRNMFNGGGFSGTESHFGTGGNGEPVEQWQDLMYTADANLDGKYRVISVENADIGPGFTAWNTNDGGAVPAFTPKQLEQLAQLMADTCKPSAHANCPSSWACHKDGIPLSLIPDSKPGRRGIGYHAQGVSGVGLVAGGERWSTSVGKVCPGKRRIAQIPGIIARAKEILGYTAVPVNPDNSVTGEIGVKYRELGGYRGFLGAPYTAELTCPDGVGKRVHFVGDGLPAAIYWTGTTGAHEIHGEIFNVGYKNADWENGPLGYPTSDELKCPDGVGRYQVFSSKIPGYVATIYWTPSTGAHGIYGDIFRGWAAQGFETAAGLGYPLNDESDSDSRPGSRVQTFERGQIFWLNGVLDVVRK